jgi:peptidyl-prolyl cis-trans isomerase SurA
MIKIQTIAKEIVSVLLSGSLLFFMPLAAQENPVLFTIEDAPVQVSEFRYIYEKNNRDKADYSKQSLEEYLDLYINFKLKVQRAKDEGYHLKESYIQELAGYRGQLASSYVIDKEVIDAMVEDIHQRQQKDIGVKHILIQSSEEDEAMSRMDEIKQALLEGASFEQLAGRFSDDKNSASLGGDIGYITSPLPDGYVALEEAAYSLEPGEVSDVVRTDLGFHLIQVYDTRRARGKMEGQHILIRTVKNGEPVRGAKARMDSVYQLLEEGKRTFESLAISYSEDNQTAANGGFLGTFGIGQFEETFEDALFALGQDGAYSAPFRSSVGWHIVKRRRKIPLNAKREIKQQVKARMNQGERFDLAMESFVNKLFQEEGYEENSDILATFIDSLDDSFKAYNWQIPGFDDAELFRIGSESYGLVGFGEYCKSNTKIRLRNPRNTQVNRLAEQLFRNYKDDMAVAYVQNRLEEKYADFANLIREYEEGILLFEITKDEVWDKASKDTAGLRTYFEANREAYRWKDRAVVATYTLKTTRRAELLNLVNESFNQSSEELMERYNMIEPDRLSIDREMLEIGSEALKGLNFERGSMTEVQMNNALQVASIRRVEEIVPASLKSLREARGYVISDYQDVLEKSWIQELRDSYQIVLNDEVFESLIVE